MIYAVGDIHGHFDKLESLLGKIRKDGYWSKDRLVFLGDYGDRGPSTPQVIDKMIQIKKERPDTVFLRGNHDQALLDAREVFDRKRGSDKTPEDVLWWWSCGARETLASYGGGAKWYELVPEAHWEFLESTTLEHREGPYIFVHAGLVPPGEKWTEPDDPRLWIRERFIGSKAEFGGIVVFGHTPQDLFFPIVMANKIGIDTGAAYSGPLTAVVLDPDKPYKPEAVRFIHS